MLAGTFPFGHHWALTHGLTRASTHTLCCLQTHNGCEYSVCNAQCRAKCLRGNIMNNQRRVSVKGTIINTFRWTKMSHFVIINSLIWHGYEHSLQCLCVKIEKQHWKNDKWLLTLYECLWFCVVEGIHQPPHSKLGQPHIYIRQYIHVWIGTKNGV